MHRWLLVALFACLVSACATADDPRYQFGVSGDRPAGSANAEADQKMKTYLDAKANQICTRGYDVVKVDTVGAEDQKEIVDLEVRCKAYRPSVLPINVDNLF